MVSEDYPTTAPSWLGGQNRLRLISICFCAAFLAIGGQLLKFGLRKPEVDAGNPALAQQDRLPRPDVVDRNGVLLATDVEVGSLYADPRKIIDIDEAVELLTTTVPDLDAKTLRAKLSQPGKAFSWLKRQVSPEERDAVYNLGIPGVGFVNERRRVYPMGRLAAHTVGYVDLDTKGIAGVEKYLDDRGAIYTASLGDSASGSVAPAQLSIDTRVQHAMADELSAAIEKFKAIAGGAVVLNIKTGEVIGLVSLPDFNPNQEDKKFSKEQANRMLSGVFELGSVIKPVTFAMAFDYGVTDLNGHYDARLPLVIGHARISDYHAERRILSVPEVFKHSSNIGTARMALQVGEEKHQEFLRRVGLFDRLTTEMPESAMPLLPNRWSKLVTATAAFGHGFAVQPLQGISVIGGFLNDGMLVPPTFIKRDVAEAQVLGNRIVSHETAEKMRYLFRLNVEEGTAQKAEVIGYRVGGKTGTAEKVVQGRYSKSNLLNSFIGAFPMEDPSYAIIVMLDEPKAVEGTFGFATSGWNAVPAAGKIIARIAPMLGVLPKFSPQDLEKLAKQAKSQKKEG